MIWTVIYCTHFVSMNLENMSSLQKWPVLGAVSQSDLISHIIPEETKLCNSLSLNGLSKLSRDCYKINGRNALAVCYMKIRVPKLPQW